MKSEMVGPGPHDGAYFDVPEGTVAVVMISPSSDGYDGSLAIMDGAAVTMDDIADVLNAIVDEMPNQWWRGE